MPPEKPRGKTVEEGALPGTPAGGGDGRSGSSFDLQEKIKDLVRLAQEQGYLTYSDINDALPDRMVSPDDRIAAVTVPWIWSRITS